PGGPRALPPAYAARARALAPAPDRAGQRRPDARHLLDHDRAGLRPGALPDPSHLQAGTVWHARPGGAGRTAADPPPQPLRAARLRHLALLRDRQTHPRARLRLPQAALGIEKRGLTTFFHHPEKRGLSLFITAAA